MLTAPADIDMIVACNQATPCRIAVNNNRCVFQVLYLRLKTVMKNKEKPVDGAYLWDQWWSGELRLKSYLRDVSKAAKGTVVVNLCNIYKVPSWWYVGSIIALFYLPTISRQYFHVFDFKAVRVFFASILIKPSMLYLKTNNTYHCFLIQLETKIPYIF